LAAVLCFVRSLFGEDYLGEVSEHLVDEGVGRAVAMELCGLVLLDGEAEELPRWDAGMSC